MGLGRLAALWGGGGVLLLVVWKEAAGTGSAGGEVLRGVPRVGVRSGGEHRVWWCRAAGAWWCRGGGVVVRVSVGCGVPRRVREDKGGGL